MGVEVRAEGEEGAGEEEEDVLVWGAWGWLDRGCIGDDGVDEPGGYGLQKQGKAVLG